MAEASKPHRTNNSRSTGLQRSNDDWIVELTLELIWAMFKVPATCCG
jgi:hypothetical protein